MTSEDLAPLKGPSGPLAASLMEPVVQNNSRPPKSPEDRWQWDFVTWSIILLIAVTVLLLWVELFPHGLTTLGR